MKPKEPILILAYFYPPCNLTASQRIYAWVRYLHEFGYYPIVVTRNWDIPIQNTADVLLATGTEIKIEKTENYEVHYVPYHASLRDRTFNRFKGTPLQFLSKLLTALEIFSQGFLNTFIAHSNMYEHARTILVADKRIKKVIASGKPFDLFKFGYLLRREFPISWIADYRDPWGSQLDAVKRHSPAEKFGINQIALEKKWVGTASKILSVSQPLVDGISKLVQVKGEVVMNGFMEDEYPVPSFASKTSEERKVFTILHVGTLPEEIKIEMILEGAKQLIDQWRERCELIFDFVGVNFIVSMGNRIKANSIGYEGNIIASDRMPRIAVFAKQEKADMLLMCGHQYKGYPSSKIYEYVGMGKPVLLMPSDHDIMEETLTSTGQAVIANSPEEMIAKLNPLIGNFVNEGRINIPLNLVARMQYSRRNQTRVLSEILDRME